MATRTATRTTTKPLCFDRAQLLAAVQKVAPLANGRAKPILGYCLLTTWYNGLATLRCCSDQMLQGVATVPIQSASPQHGELLLPVARLLAILRELQGEEVYLEPSQNGLKVFCEGASFKLATDTPLDFPPLEAGQPEWTFDCRTAGLMASIRHATLAIERADTRYALAGVAIDCNNLNDVRIVATDTRQLVVRGLPIENLQTEQRHDSGTFQQERLCKIPAEAAKVLLSILQAGDTARLELSPTRFCVMVEGHQVSGPCVTGRFPKYEAVIPQRAPTIAVVMPSVMTRLCRMASTVTSGDQVGVLVSFTDGEVSLSAETADVGDANVRGIVETRLEQLERKRFDTRFDGRRLQQMFDALPFEDAVEWKQQTGDDALLLSRDGVTHVLMPLADD